MANYGNAISGGVSGASTGAAFGGPIGATIGGIAGFAGGLFGSKKKKKKLSSFDKRQKRLNEEQYAALRGEGPLADIYDYNPERANEVFDKTIANPAYRNYQEKLAPNITGQFRSNGLMQSSYAGDALSRLARDVQENLNAERSKYLYGRESEARGAKQNAIENLQNRSTFDYDNSKGANMSPIDKILKSLSPEAIESIKGTFGKKKPEAEEE